MKNILGLHFGHDGAACVTAEGRILSYLQTERRTRIKHAGGMPSMVIDEALRHAGMRPDDVELVAVTSTQNRECLFDNPGVFAFEFAPNGFSAPVDQGYARVRPSLPFIHEVRRAHDARESRPNDPSVKQWPYFSHLTPSVGYPAVRFQLLRAPLEQQLRPAHASAAITACTLPIVCTLFGRRVPGLFVDHHAAHCASVFYKSPFQTAAVVSADGGKTGNFGGFVMLGRDDGLVPVETHEFIGGPFYAGVAERIGLDSGKLMGLAGHGTASGRRVGLRDRNLAEAVGEFLAPFADGLDAAVRDPMGVTGRTLAADAQSAFETGFAATIFEAVERLAPVLPEPTVCLSGGCALNCPTNSMVMQKFGDDRVFIESSCNDEGLAFGGAAWAFVNIVGGVIGMDARRHNRSPFQGAYPNDTRRAFERARAGGLALVDAGEPSHNGLRQAMLRGEIGAVMRGKSEIGPRALGNRSILGRADIADHHRRINHIKRREQWRPLAPAVPARLFARYFDGPRNPYMLATCRVATGLTPAVRHADGSARVQVLDDADDLLAGVADALEAAGRPGVLINTSFNGRDNPLFDDACDAVDFLARNDDMRYVLIEDVLVRKPDDTR